MDSFDTTFGAMYIGAAVSMALYGITTTQTYFYFIHYPTDPQTIQATVWVIWILDTLHIIFMNHALYAYLVSDTYKPQARADGIWSLYASLAVNLVIAVIVQGFFTKRIYRLCKPRFKWWISSIIGFFVFAHFVFGIETVVEFFIKKQFRRLPEVNFTAATPFAIAAILSDVLIALALCTLLDMNRSGFKDTNTIINRLIVFAINRCVLTSAVSIVVVILFVLLPHSFYSFAFDFTIGKLYANSFLATLNSRHALASSSHGGPSGSLVLTSIRAERFAVHESQGAGQTLTLEEGPKGPAYEMSDQGSRV